VNLGQSSLAASRSIEPEGALTDATVTCCQLSPVIGDAAHNRELSLHAIADAATAGSDLIVLPELVTSGYCFESADESQRLAITRQDPIFDEWAAAAGSAIVVGGFPEIDRGALYNSAVLIEPEGGRTWYRKTHLWDAEKEVFTAGDRPPPIVDTKLGRLALLVCYDLEFPELTRNLALAGADLFVVPANWPLLGPIPAGEHAGEVVIAMATARMNHVFVACCDRSGTERGQAWTEGSAIVSADGWVVAEADGHAVISAVLDLESARNKRITKRNDAFLDRRPELYQG
jgi:predicted amidohydrolase